MRERATCKSSQKPLKSSQKPLAGNASRPTEYLSEETV